LLALDREKTRRSATVTTPDVYEAIKQASLERIINDWWDKFEGNIDFLADLVKMGREHEAIILCAAYLDGVGGALAPSGAKNGPSFCDALSKHEKSPYLSLVHPLQMIRAAGKSAALKPGGVWQNIESKLQARFPGPTFELLPQADFITQVTPILTSQELGDVRANLWKGTIAGVVYEWIRNPAIHELGSTPTLSFGQTGYHGFPVPSINLDFLVPVLRRMTKTARAKSIATRSLP
jgi:hypothetical protein